MSLIEKVQLWYARSPIASAVKSFAVVVVTLAVADWVKLGSIDFAAWQTWTIAALASAIVPALNALNPADKRYGRTYGFIDPSNAGPDGEK